MVNINTNNGMVYFTPTSPKPLVPKVPKDEATPGDPAPFDDQLQKYAQQKGESSPERGASQPSSKDFYKVKEENIVTEAQLAAFHQADLANADAVFNTPSVLLKPQTDKLLRHAVALNDLQEGKEVSPDLVDRELIAFNVENAQKAVIDFMQKSQGKAAPEQAAQATGLNILSAVMKSTLELEQFKGQSPETGYSRA
jgi:hypothetical protein